MRSAQHVSPCRPCLTIKNTVVKYDILDKDVCGRQLYHHRHSLSGLKVHFGLWHQSSYVNLFWLLHVVHHPHLTSLTDKMSPVSIILCCARHKQCWWYLAQSVFALSADIRLSRLICDDWHWAVAFSPTSNPGNDRSSVTVIPFWVIVGDQRCIAFSEFLKATIPFMLDAASRFTGCSRIGQNLICYNFSLLLNITQLWASSLKLCIKSVPHLA